MSVWHCGICQTKCTELAIKHKMLTCPSGAGPKGLSCNIPLEPSFTWLLGAQSCCQRHMCKLCGALDLNSELQAAIWFYLHCRICCLLYAGRVHRTVGGLQMQLAINFFWLFTTPMLITNCMVFEVDMVRPIGMQYVKWMTVQFEFVNMRECFAERSVAYERLRIRQRYRTGSRGLWKI